MASVPPIPNVTLNNGVKIPILGLGTWKSEPNVVGEAVKLSLKLGFRHIDCASAYLNEKEIGDAINEFMQENSVKREEIFITSKLWNTHHSRNEAFKHLDQTLQDLGTDYVDLYLIHWPVGFKEGTDGIFPTDADGKLVTSDVDYMETWLALEDMYKRGKAKAIGLANFSRKQIDRVLKEGTIVPAMLQIESHPYYNQTKMLEYCKEKGIAITAYSPLGSGDRPFALPDDPVLLKNPVLAEIGKKYNKSAAQVCIKFQVQRGVIVIPKSTIERELKENLQVFDFTLSDEDMKTLTGLDINCKFINHDWLASHKYYPFIDDNVKLTG